MDIFRERLLNVCKRIVSVTMEQNGAQTRAISYRSTRGVSSGFFWGSRGRPDGEALFLRPGVALPRTSLFIGTLMQ